MTPDDYTVKITHNETGEDITLEEYLDILYAHLIKRGRFEFASPKHLAEMLEVIPNTGAQILAHLIKCKGPGNVILKTNQEIAEDLEVGINSVGRIMSKLISAGMLRKKDRGVYVMNPEVLVYGRGNRFKAIELWESLS